MVKIVYMRADGRASNLRFMPLDYTLAASEIEIAGDRLPEIDTLHSLEHLNVLKMERVRAERNRRLAVTDFMTLPDYPNAPAGLAAYRQALRDFPATVDVATLSWPLEIPTLAWPVL